MPDHTPPEDTMSSQTRTIGDRVDPELLGIMRSRLREFTLHHPEVSGALAGERLEGDFAVIAPFIDAHQGHPLPQWCEYCHARYAWEACEDWCPDRARHTFDRVEYSLENINELIADLDGIDPIPQDQLADAASTIDANLNDAVCAIEEFNAEQ
jgi:hypothetical protein